MPELLHSAIVGVSRGVHDHDFARDIDIFEDSVPVAQQRARTRDTASLNAELSENRWGVGQHPCRSRTTSKTEALIFLPSLQRTTAAVAQVTPENHFEYRHTCSDFLWPRHVSSQTEERSVEGVFIPTSLRASGRFLQTPHRVAKSPNAESITMEIEDCHDHSDELCSRTIHDAWNSLRGGAYGDGGVESDVEAAYPATMFAESTHLRDICESGLEIGTEDWLGMSHPIPSRGSGTPVKETCRQVRRLKRTRWWEDSEDTSPTHGASTEDHSVSMWVPFTKLSYNTLLQRRLPRNLEDVLIHGLCQHLELCQQFGGLTKGLPLWIAAFAHSPVVQCRLETIFRQNYKSMNECVRLPSASRNCLMSSQNQLCVAWPSWIPELETSLAVHTSLNVCAFRFVEDIAMTLQRMREPLSNQIARSTDSGTYPKKRIDELKLAVFGRWCRAIFGSGERKKLLDMFRDSLRPYVGEHATKDDEAYPVLSVIHFLAWDWMNTLFPRLGTEMQAFIGQVAQCFVYESHVAECTMAFAVTFHQASMDPHDVCHVVAMKRRAIYEVSHNLPCVKSWCTQPMCKEEDDSVGAFLASPSLQLSATISDLGTTSLRWLLWQDWSADYLQDCPHSEAPMGWYLLRVMPAMVQRILSFQEVRSVMLRCARQLSDGSQVNGKLVVSNEDEHPVKESTWEALQAHLFRGTAFRFFLCLLLWRGSADISVPENPSNSELRNWIDPLWQAWLLPFFISHQTASWWRRPLHGVEHVDDELSHVHHGVLEVGKYYVHRTRQLVEQVQSLQNSGKQHVIRADGYQFQRYGTTTGVSPSLCCSADTGSMTYSRMSTVEHGVAPLQDGKDPDVCTEIRDFLPIGTLPMAKVENMWARTEGVHRATLHALTMTLKALSLSLQYHERGEDTGVDEDLQHCGPWLTCPSKRYLFTALPRMFLNDNGDADSEDDSTLPISLSSPSNSVSPRTSRISLSPIDGSHNPLLPDSFTSQSSEMSRE